ncbi:hypothetical protein CKO38_08950 [Rhodospirillum rubrum]|uniref:tetratricopeptide repeat protein n=1 Tax=Rhodospirillum rubrum TaxID=1085 RepID=UPI001908A9F4|nr:tetratricopeptide repeat protein [Rhodospirillum rubrum]MBK1664875.1 hypothetical protein [Rhodospirillum rubrum]MBK1676796.1 hypothetical protein [Rhodospirillum rubrum]
MAIMRHGLAASVMGTALAMVVAVLPAGCANGQVGETNRPGTTPPSEIALAPSGLGSYLAARHAEAEGDTEAAAAFYLTALADDPDNLNLLRRAYFFNTVEGKVSEAAKLASRLMVSDPTATIAPLVISADLAKRGQMREAATLINGQNRQGLNSFLVPVALAWTRAGAGDAAGAMTALDELSKNAGYATLRALHGALLQEQLGNKAKAGELYEAYVKGGERPSLRGVQLAGGFFVRSGQAARARALAADYSQRFPDSLLLDNAVAGFAEGETPPAPEVRNAKDGMAELYYGTASLLADNDLQTATMFNRLALHLRPDFPLAQLLLGQLLAGQSRHDDAIAAYRAIESHDTLMLAAGLAEAESLRAQGKIDDAVVEFDKLAAHFPSRPDPLIEKGDLLRQDQRFADAATAYSAAIARMGAPDPRHWAVYFGRGVAYERTDRWPLAEQDFQTALRLNPDQPFVLNYLGYSWLDNGINVDQAKQLIERAVAQRPKDGYIIDSLGWAHFRLGEYAEAVGILERAIHETPDDATINDHLGDAYWMVGRRLEARYQWERALSLADEADLSASIQKKLDTGLSPPRPVVPRSAGRPAERQPASATP